MMDETSIDPNDVPDDESADDEDEESGGGSPDEQLAAKGAGPGIDHPAHPKNRASNPAIQAMQQAMTAQGLGQDKSLNDARQAMTKQERDGALLASLSKSAAQMGSVGGKVADSSAVGDMAKGLDSAAQQDYGAQAAQAQKRQAMQQYLIGQMQKRDMADNTLNTRKEIATNAITARQGELADAEKGKNTRAEKLLNLRKQLADNALAKGKEPQLAQIQSEDDDGNPTVKFVKKEDGAEYATRSPKVSAEKSAKAATDQEKLYRDAVKEARTSRSEPGVAQAQKALVNVDNAYGMVNKYIKPGMTPEQQAAALDQMKPDEHAFLIAELGKIASGGVAGEHTQNLMAAHTLKSNWDKTMQTIWGEPTGADLGKFIMNNKAYLDELKSTNQNAVDNHIKSVFSGNEHVFNKEQQERWKNDPQFSRLYPKSPPAANAPIASAPASGPGVANAAPKAKPGPGAVVTIKGVKYRVGDDGDSLDPVAAGGN